MKKVGYLFALVLLTGPSWAQVIVSEGYVRATPPMGPNTAAFMQLENGGDRDLALVSAASPQAEKVELHTVLEQDGVMRMREVERIAVPAGDAVSLQPGGLHIMLLGVKQPLAAGDEVSLELRWDNGDTEQLLLPVKDIRTQSQAAHGHDHHH
ncbi:copper chaperone PCu(A)C [Zobellella iuensis]|uniref:Copper chaperone PCu(A)C n=1 Tax=Zobellella iuensis TaxID=2803811 RepID=A0ABS1QVQ5_9GAMM|nr:copper chaperone PCu(A)C [Zobellella iuensis]MBL1378960.1 copper chaperone PCu(A)C [Zobellella iuensis]